VFLGGFLCLTLAVLLRYLMKLEQHKTAHFKVSRHSILLLNSKNKSELFEAFITLADGSYGCRVFTSICLWLSGFFAQYLKNQWSTKLDLEMFHDESWKPI